MEGNANGLPTYIGTKIIQGSPLDKKGYCKLRGWQVPADENPDEDGYLVIYPDGYRSWSPKPQFEEAYRLTTGMPFGLAVEAMKKGKKCARIGWNGKQMYAVIMPGYPDGIEVNEVTQKAHNLPEGTKLIYRPYFQLYTAQKDVAMWAPSGSDALAEDWIIAE
jgi:hypothetical protein